MDSANIVLDYPDMNAIPTYALYGEQQASTGHWLHWETITSRSRLYGFRIAAHRHDELYQLLYVSRGKASVMLDGESFELSPPAVIVLPPLSVHGFSFSPDIEGFVLTFFARDVRAALTEIGEEAEGLMRPGVLRPIEGVVEAGHLGRCLHLLFGRILDLLGLLLQIALGRDFHLRHVEQQVLAEFLGHHLGADLDHIAGDALQFLDLGFDAY
jgi:AraC family transcriptional activator of pobA